MAQLFCSTALPEDKALFASQGRHIPAEMTIQTPTRPTPSPCHKVQTSFSVNIMHSPPKLTPAVLEGEEKASMRCFEVTRVKRHCHWTPEPELVSTQIKAATPEPDILKK